MLNDFSEIKTELGKVISDETEKIIMSLPDKAAKYKKLEIRKIIIKQRECYQIAGYTDKQAFQSNVDKTLLLGKLLEYFPSRFSQINIFNPSYEMSFRVTKKGKLLKNKNNKIKTEAGSKEHNRQKNYILEEGMAIPPLVDMGVFTKEGKVVNKMYDKFKQINRFVELLDDVLKGYPNDEIHIIDFGCGKSYLTFIVYHYLTEILHKKAYIKGLDLKKDVIEKCNGAAKKYGYENLSLAI